MNSLLAYFKLLSAAFASVLRLARFFEDSEARATLAKSWRACSLAWAWIAKRLREQLDLGRADRLSTHPTLKLIGHVGTAVFFKLIAGLLFAYALLGSLAAMDAAFRYLNWKALLAALALMLFMLPARYFQVQGRREADSAIGLWRMKSQGRLAALVALSLMLALFWSIAYLCNVRW